jgi:hypothetical protein
MPHRTEKTAGTRIESPWPCRWPSGWRSGWRTGRGTPENQLSPDYRAEFFRISLNPARYRRPSSEFLSRVAAQKCVTHRASGRSTA